MGYHSQLYLVHPLSGFPSNSCSRDTSLYAKSRLCSASTLENHDLMAPLLPGTVIAFSVPASQCAQIKDWE